MVIESQPQFLKAISRASPQEYQPNTFTSLRARNVCLLWHHPAVAAHGSDPLCAQLLRRISAQNQARDLGQAKHSKA